MYCLFALVNEAVTRDSRLCSLFAPSPWYHGRQADVTQREKT